MYTLKHWQGPNPEGPLEVVTVETLEEVEKYAYDKFNRAPDMRVKVGSIVLSSFEEWMEHKATLLQGHTHRLQLDFDAVTFKKLEELRDRTKRETLGEVTRLAYGILNIMLKYKEEGATVLVRRPNGDVSEIEVKI